MAMCSSAAPALANRVGSHLLHLTSDGLLFTGDADSVRALACVDGRDHRWSLVFCEPLAQFIANCPGLCLLHPQRNFGRAVTNVGDDSDCATNPVDHRAGAAKGCPHWRLPPHIIVCTGDWYGHCPYVIVGVIAR